MKSRFGEVPMRGFRGVLFVKTQIARLVVFVFVVSSLALLGQSATPNISNVTNAAIPALGTPAATLTVQPRSLVSIFGTDLADTTASTAPPWKTTLGGTEVHLAGDTCFDASCDIVAPLLYASPTQINFLVPMTEPSPVSAYRIVLIRDGVRIDNRAYMIGGPGRILMDQFTFDSGEFDVVFQVGYECLYSYSLIDPAACGLSWNQGEHRAALGAVTDAVTGQLITSQYPVHQGQIITLWLTGVPNLSLNQSDGLWEQGYPFTCTAPPGVKCTIKDGTFVDNFQPVNFGVAQLGNDIASGVDFGQGGNPYGGWILQTLTPLWAGESPQYPGLDQINVAFPTCINTIPATAEKRYDALMAWSNRTNRTTVRLYMPFVVRVGDKDCFLNN
jgi:hypothetical protein